MPQCILCATFVLRSPAFQPGPPKCTLRPSAFSWMADAIRLDSIFRFDQGQSDSTDPIRPACKAPGAQLMEVSRNSVLPDAFSRPRKMHLDERWILKAAPRRSMLPDAFSRLRKMHLDERWILKAAPRRSMLPDAFSRPRKMHLDERWILKAAPRRSMVPDAFSRPRKMHLDERWIAKGL